MCDPRTYLVYTVSLCVLHMTKISCRLLFVQMAQLSWSCSLLTSELHCFITSTFSFLFFLLLDISKNCKLKNEKFLGKFGQSLPLLKIFFFFLKCYVHNIFTIFSYQILSGSLLLVVIVGQKSNFSDKFKFRLIITNHL